MFAECLAEAGFAVIEVGSAEVALAILEEHAVTIAALVTGVRLVGPLDALALAHQAARHWPWSKLLIVSGEAPQCLERAPVNCGVLHKPVDPERIVVELRTLVANQRYAPSPQ